MRVVVLNHVARLSGGEIALARVLPALREQADVTVVLAEDGPLVAVLRAAGADVRVLPMSASVRDRRRDAVAIWRVADAVRVLSYSLRLAWLLRRLEADVVHTNSLKAALYGGLAGRLARVPVLWHVRDRIAADYLPVPLVRAVRLLSRILPSGVVANSAATLATLPSTERRPDVVVPDCVDNVVNQPHSVRTEPLVFGVVGRLSPWKGQDVFLRAFASAFAGTPHRARLVGGVMFGETAYEKSLSELPRLLGIDSQVELRGFVDDVVAEFDALDVLVHCSTVPEPFGQVVIEGMARGLPVIAAAAGGPAEIVRDGVDGMLVPPGDVAGLAAAMSTLATDPKLRARLGEAARETATTYPPSRTAAGLLAAYVSVQRT
ncbi:MAG: hypothetical protein QOI82_1585 [Actinomycetota bacterium]|jgi:glycosyltransferase involved in cell wall biosynthesis|nr:hypothetical protein [Actinomycetota bacterium]